MNIYVFDSLNNFVIQPINDKNINYPLLKLFCKERNISYTTFIESQDSIIILTGDFVIIGAIRNIAGRRFTIHGELSNKFIWPDQGLLQQVRKIGKLHKCDLIQSLIPLNLMNELNIYSNYFATNLVYEKLISDTTDIQKKIPIQPLDFNDTIKLKKIADLDYFTRWKFPGATVSKYDLIHKIQSEYLSFSDEFLGGNVKGLAYDIKNESAFVCWYEFKQLNLALIIFIWSDHQLRGQGVGTQLLKEAEKMITKTGISRMRYIVALTNYSAQKMLAKSGFEPKYLIVNNSLN